MKRIRLVIPVLALVLALIPASAMATATKTYVESVLGVETGPPQITVACPAPNSVSSFAGIARGTLNGGFQIAVCHTPLSPSATISEGTFRLSDGRTVITGSFASGTVSYVTTFIVGSLCIQKFAVSGELSSSSGTFAGTLLHYGHGTVSSCNVFFATISGKATITA
jgi:hypothetical protein